MRVCHCNLLTDDDIDRTIEGNLAVIAAAASLLKAVGVVHREALKAEGRTANPCSCTICFNQIAVYVKEAGLFQDQTLPEPTRCAACPRRAECLFIPA